MNLRDKFLLSFQPFRNHIILSILFLIIIILFYHLENEHYVIKKAQILIP